MKFKISEVHLMGILFSCPMGEPVENCPFRECHKMPATHKMVILQSLSPGDRNDIYCYHHACSYYRRFGKYEKIRYLTYPLPRDFDPEL